MRLFAAIDLDDASRTALASEQARLRTHRACTDVRFVSPSRLHLTLVFIGEVPEARVGAIVEALSMAIDLPPYALVFAGVGVFPSSARPQTLWIGVAEGAQETCALQACVADRLDPLGIAREARPFRPHLTLGRWPRGRSRGRWSPPPVTGAVARTRVEAVTLFASRLSSAGPAYTALATARLECPPS